MSDDSTDRSPFPDALPEALRRRLDFVLELDRLKGIERRCWRLDRSRRENSAEHSWHLATMALALAEYAPPGADLWRVVRLLLVHDVVEIDAGDTFAFDVAGQVDQSSRERAAATRLFGLLPDAQGGELRALWDEFEAGESAEARFAHALDRLQPLLLNLHTEGGSWVEHGVARGAVLRRMAPIERGAPGLWPVVVAAVERAVEVGWVRGEE